MFSVPWFFVFLYGVNFIQCELCNGNLDCLTKGANLSFPLFIKGIENTVETSDPIQSEYILVETPTFKCEFRNSNFTGLKDCSVEKLSVNRSDSKFFFHLECPRVVIYFHYQLNGTVASYFVEGNGLATVILDHYVFKFDGDYKKKLDDDNKVHGKITNYTLSGEAEGFVNFNFENLYGGDTEKSNIIHKFMNDNWRAMDKDLRGPPIYSFMGTFIKHLNKYLEAIPLQDLGIL